MMKSLVYLVIGVFFGIVMYKSEAASWFRIFEMFQFRAFHMYGIIGSALVLGIIVTQTIKRTGVKSFYGNKITIEPKKNSIKRYLIGGVIFGLGWALAGACPGPMYVLIGAGFLPVVIVLLAAILGTYLYGVLKDKLPH